MMMQKFMRKIFGVTVRVYWEELMVEHSATSAADALEWAACYPVDAKVYIFNRVRKLIAVRGV